MASSGSHQKFVLCQPVGRIEIRTYIRWCQSNLSIKGPSIMKINRIMVALLFAGITASCATIVSDSSYPLAVNSNPDGASFTVTNREGVEVNRGTTPMTVELKAG